MMHFPWEIRCIDFFSICSYFDSCWSIVNIFYKLKTKWLKISWYSIKNPLICSFVVRFSNFKESTILTFRNIYTSISVIFFHAFFFLFFCEGIPDSLFSCWLIFWSEFFKTFPYHCTGIVPDKWNSFWWSMWPSLYHFSTIGYYSLIISLRQGKATSEVCNSWIWINSSIF